MIRSLLFLPGNQPNLIIHADEFGADAVIYDLEDSVAPDQKDSARILVRNALRHARPLGCGVVIRVNALDTPYCAKDLSALIPLRPDHIMLPKVDSDAMIREADALMAQAEEASGIPVGSTGLIPLIETALGVENAGRIAQAGPRVKGMLLGAEDLTADLGCVRTKAGNEIDYARKRLVVAAKAAGILIFDTPFTDVNDDEGIYTDAQYARSLGYTGKSSISPRHIGPINEVFSPSLEEIRYAYEVLRVIGEARASGSGVAAYKGKMIDAPIETRARNTIAAAEALGIGKEVLDHA